MLIKSGMSLSNAFDVPLEGQNGITIPSHRLDGLMGLCGEIKHPALLKIDCEGAEHHMMDDKKAAKALSDMDVVVMELHRVPGKIGITGYFSWLRWIFNSTHILWFCSGNKNLGHCRIIRRTFCNKHHIPMW